MLKYLLKKHRFDIICWFLICAAHRSVNIMAFEISAIIICRNCANKYVCEMSCDKLSLTTANDCTPVFDQSQQVKMVT